jgi:hypothetical protein
LEAGEELMENHVIGVLVNKIVDHVKCELGQAILFEIHYDKANTLDSGAKRNVLKRSGFERPFQARQSRLGMAS